MVGSNNDITILI
ncbi:hypothetical protein YPPY03_0991, partial [Yersinia pestis PY-03]